MRFLCASNLNLGRRISGMPEHAGIDPLHASASVVLDRLARAAVASDVDAVLLAGDVIDREAGQFEPIGALQEALGLLAREGIPVIAIAGDEDFDALPRAIDMFGSDIPQDGITLLDAESPSVDIGPEGDQLTVIGLSQTGRMGMDDPLSALPHVETNRPTLVMLHASLTDGNAPDATFQPVRLDDLTASTIDLWVLGGQREPDVVEQDGTIVVETGSIAPADRDETGQRGATLVERSADGHIECRLVPLSPVQFSEIDVDVTALESLEAVEGAIVGALNSALDEAIPGDTLASLSAVICTVHLTGVSALHSELHDFTGDLARTLAVERQGISGVVASIEVNSRPDVDIEPLLGRPDPVGELARLIRVLDDQAEPTPAQEALVRRATDRLLGVHRSRIFAGVANDPEPDEETARAFLQREAWNVLDALVRQRGVD